MRQLLFKAIKATPNQENWFEINERKKYKNEESVAYVHYFDFLFKFQGVKNPGKFQLDMILKEPWWY